MPMNNDKRGLILICGGGHCKSVIEAARSAGLEIRGILDLPERVGELCGTTEVIGSDCDIPAFAAECDFVVTLGFVTHPTRRNVLIERVRAAGGRFATVIASLARVADSASVGNGTVVLHNVCINAGAQIGDNCIINTAAIIEHDARIGNGTHVSTGAIVNGDCRIGSNVMIGSGAVIVNGVSVADGTIIGAGAVVTKNIEHQGTYAGVPAKLINHG